MNVCRTFVIGVGMTPHLNRGVTATLEQGCNGLNEKVMHVSMQSEVLNEGHLSGVQIFYPTLLAPLYTPQIKTCHMSI